MATKTNDLAKLPDVLKQAQASRTQQPQAPQGLLERHWHANLGLKTEYELQERTMPIRFQLSFFRHEPKSVVQLGSRFPDGIDIKQGKVSKSICQVLANFAEMTADGMLYETDYASFESPQRLLLAWLEIFNLPNDGIDFCKWLVFMINDHKINFTAASMKKFDAKHYTQKNVYYFLPYDDLYVVYKSNVTKKP